LLVHLSKTLICSDSFSTNRTSSPVDFDSGDRKPASKETVDNTSLMEPDNDGWPGASSDDGPDGNAYDKPWACMKTWESTNNEITKSGSNGDSNADVADTVVIKSNIVNCNESDHPMKTDNVARYGIAFSSPEYVEQNY
jgi:hypothetical protein